MTIFILLILAFVAFAFYRYRQYQKQREIEEMAADAQAYVSSEVVELLQRFKTIATENETAMSAQHKKIQLHIKNLTENLLCHTDSEQSVREYLAQAKQEIALINIELEKLSGQKKPDADQAFDDLK